MEVEGRIWRRDSEGAERAEWGPETAIKPGVSEGVGEVDPKKRGGVSEEIRCKCGIAFQALSLNDAHMASDQLVACRVSKATKQRLRQLARHEQRTESQVLRDLIELAFRTRPGLPTVEAAPPPRRLRRERLNVRLDVNDRRRLIDRAAAARVPVATYVAVLVRSHLCQVAPPLDEHVALMRQEIRNLVAVGRHLAKLNETIDKTARAPASLQKEVAAMLTVCGALRDHTRSLLQAHIDSWEVGYDVDEK